MQATVSFHKIPDTDTTLAPTVMVKNTNSLVRAFTDVMSSFGIEKIDTGRLNYGSDNRLSVLNPKVLNIEGSEDHIPKDIKHCRRTVVYHLAELMDTMGISAISLGTGPDDRKTLIARWGQLNEESG